MTKKKVPQRKPESAMSDKELIQKMESKIYGTKPKDDMEKLEEVIKNRLNNFDKFSL